ncbi:MAG: nucleotide exchange factor GrpE [Terriglobales bacterium]
MAMDKEPVPAAPPEAAGSEENPPAGADLESALAQAREEREQLRQQLLRSLADFDNFRKRMRREHEEQRLHGVQEAVRLLLPAGDNLDRALSHPAASAADLRRGIELTGRQWAEALHKLGVEPVPTVGETFNPHWHQAVEMVDTREAPDHTVIEELQRGYQLQGRLLRPAMVRVARNPGPGGPEPDTEAEAGGEEDVDA